MSTPAENVYWYAVGDGKAYAVYISESEKAISESLRNCVNVWADTYSLICFEMDGINIATMIPRLNEPEVYYEIVNDSRRKLSLCIEGAEVVLQVREDGLSRMSERPWPEDEEEAVVFPNSLDEWEWDYPEWTETTYA